MTFYWDFYGPDAEGTATHHRRHVEEFLAARGIAGGLSGVQLAEGHAAAWYEVPAERADEVGLALRPRRFSEAPPE